MGRWGGAECVGSEGHTFLFFLGASISGDSGCLREFPWLGRVARTELVGSVQVFFFFRDDLET